jgi:hypothetical protein
VADINHISVEKLNNHAIRKAEEHFLVDSLSRVGNDQSANCQACLSNIVRGVTATFVAPKAYLVTPRAWKTIFMGREELVNGNVRGK